MKRRKKSVLPRLTVLAYSRRDLERFSHAMESMAASIMDLERLLVKLEEQVNRIDMRTTRASKKKAAAIAPECGCQSCATDEIPKD